MHSNIRGAAKPAVGRTTGSETPADAKAVEASPPPEVPLAPAGDVARLSGPAPAVVVSARVEGLASGLAGLAKRMERIAAEGAPSRSDRGRLEAWVHKLQREVAALDGAAIGQGVAATMRHVVAVAHQQGATLGIEAKLGPLTQSLRAIAGPAPVYSVEDAIADLHIQFGPLFEDIRHASENPQEWTDLAKRADYTRLLLQLKFHVTGAAIRPAPPIHAAVIDEVIAQTGIMRAELSELTAVPSQRLHRGAWMPTSARMLRLADDALTAKSDDRIIRALDDVSNRHLPDVQRVGLGPLTLPYFLADKALPVIDTVGKFTEQKVLEVVAGWLDTMGDGLRSEVQTKYREIKRSTASLGVKRKDLESDKYSETDKKMIVLAAATLNQAASDVDSWMTLLAEPDRAKDEGFVDKTLGGVRTSLDAAAWMIHGMASSIHSLTDEESWRLFSARLEVGAGFEIATFGMRGGWAFMLPSLAEYKLAKKAEICIETLFTPIASPLGNAEITSRGGKYAFSAGPLNVREAEFSQAVNMKLQGIGGVAFQRDKVLGPGFEAGMSPTVGLLGVFNLRAGGEVAIFHPGMNAWDRPVNRAATLLGNATEAVSDLISASYHSAKNALVEPEAGELTPKKLRKSRLGRSNLTARKATVSLGVVKSYRAALEAATDAGLPPFSADNPAYREMTRGYSEAEALTVIGGFLDDIEGRLESTLGAVRILTDADEGTPWQERKLRSEIRGATKDVAEADQMFGVADTLLSQLFTGVEWAPAGPFAELLAGEQLTGVALSEARADAAVERITLAMSYGALDWVVTDSEALTSFKTLAALDDHGRARALEKLEPKILQRLVTNLPAGDDAVTAQLYSDIHEAADR